MAGSKSRRERRHQRKLAKKPKPGGGGPALQDALAHHQAGRLKEAEQGYRKVIAAEPGLFEAHVNLGVVLQGQGRLADGAESFRSAAALNPDYAEVHYALGTVLEELDDLDEARASFQRAVDIKPDYVEALNGLAIGLQKQGKPAEAIETFERALEIDPGFAETLNNLGNLYHREGRIEDALETFRRAIAIAPDYAEAHRNLSQALLMAGRLDEGWRESGWRWKCRDFPSEKRDFPQPLWEGEPLKGKKILVWGEQGVGDEVHFAGMVPDLLDAGAKVVLESDPRLAPLFERSFAGVECAPRETPPWPGTGAGDIDYQIPSGDLGRWFRPDLDSFPGRDSYLAADEKLRLELRDRYRKDPEGLLVGIAWISKNPEIGKAKSMPLADWRPLAGIPGVTFVNLQYGDTRDEREAFEKEAGTPVLDDGGIDQLADLDAFAAQVAAMDLVISVSNTTVHFSGAMGVPTWVLLNTVPLPVWMMGRDDCPWHPSVRLFRQSQAGGWADVIGRVGKELRAFAGR